MHKKLHDIIQNKSHRTYLFIGVFIFVIMVLLISQRLLDAVALRQTTNENAIELVSIINAKAARAIEHLILPGTIKAWHETPIYARTNGYVKKWLVDIGSQVKKGDLLAVIETPELNDQLHQAEANLNTIIAQNNLAQLTAKRWLNLLKSDSVSQQETDDKVHAAEALKAEVLAAIANRNRLRNLVAFERVLAPFSGIISERSVDIGDLINEGSNPAAKPMFRIVQNNPLRLYVKIPEFYSTRIKQKMMVTLQFKEHPSRQFTAHLLKTANAIDPTTRTLLAQFKVNNDDNILLPGSYTEVKFSMQEESNSVMLPVNALIFQAQGLQVATLDNHNQVRLKPITVTTDYGDEVQVNQTIHVGEQIIINPSDALYEGEVVHIISTRAHAGEKKLLS